MAWLGLSLRFDDALVLLVPLVLAVLGYYLIDTGLVASAISLATGNRQRTLWHDQFRWLAMHYLTLCLIGAFTAMAVAALGRWGILICTLPLFLTRYAQAQYVARTEVSTAELRRMNRELQEANGAIVGTSEAIQQLNLELNDLNDQLFETLARFFDARDPYVGGHAAKVADYAEAIAHELGLTPEQCKRVRQAGYLHDIGKIAIPEHILHKPGPLTAAEYAIVQTHATLGADLLEQSRGLQPLATFVRCHHERWDGKGYPAGLRGTAIPLESRILNLCDSVEAMASDRPYHRGQPPEAVIAEVVRCTGHQFDPAVAAAFLRVVAREGSEAIVNSAQSIQRQRQLIQPPMVELGLVSSLTGCGASAERCTDRPTSECRYPAETSLATLVGAS